MPVVSGFQLMAAKRQKSGDHECKKFHVSSRLFVLELHWPIRAAAPILARPGLNTNSTADEITYPGTVDSRTCTADIPAMPLKLSSIRWIAFDAVGTLIFADPPVHLAYYRIGQKYGSGLSPGEVRIRFQAAFAEREPVAAADATGEREFWRSVVADVFADVDAPEACFEELFAHFAEPASWQCFADVEETLAELAGRGFRLAIVSNFDTRLHGICDGLPELCSITRRIISSEVGVRKPHPSFYRAVMTACECSVDEVLIIGDDHENDVAGPRRLGISAWHLHRGTGGDGDCVRSLSEVVDRLPASCGVG